MNDPKPTHDPVPFALMLQLRAFQTALELLAIHRCPVGLTPFYDNALFPWAAGLEDASRDIIDEFERAEARLADIPALEDLSPGQRFVTNDKNWKTLVLQSYDGAVSPLAREMCPRTVHALRAIPGVRLAFFSILEPGKRIPPHRGPYRGILRAHLGVRIPKDSARCRIRVDDQWRSWEKGKLLILDDSYEHEVANDTNERRVVLFIDFVRPLKAPFDRINHLLLTRVLDRAKFAQTLSDRQTAWEAKIRAEWARAAAEDPLDRAAE